jgi:hypothetical protein
MLPWAIVVGLAAIMVAGTSAVEAFLLANYVVASDHYGREPGHRFRALWVSRTDTVVESSNDARLATDLKGRRVRWLLDKGEPAPWRPGDLARFDTLVRDVTTCAPELAAYAGDIFPYEVVEFPRGRVLSFYIWRQSSAANPWQALFLSSLIVSLDGRCLSLRDTPKDLDVETRSIWRTFWDIVPFKGHDYLVISNQGYEHAELEAYRVDGSRLTLVLHRIVGGL